MTFFHQQDGPAYYSEFDEEKAYWLRELMRENVIAPGVIDTRSIEDVAPTELTGFVQHHFFAGIGVWSYAARLAGWPDDQPIRTLSCPCQPFSSAGQGAAFDDPRHLWPAACWHIEFGSVRPTFGEQVASSDGLNWLDLVSADLEAAHHSIAAFDLCSAGIGSPNLRSRLYYAAEYSGVVPVDNTQQARLEGYAGHGRDSGGWEESIGSTSKTGASCLLVDAAIQRLGQAGSDGGRRDEGVREEGWAARPSDERCAGIMAQPNDIGHDRAQGYEAQPRSNGENHGIPERNGSLGILEHPNLAISDQRTRGGEQSFRDQRDQHRPVEPTPGPVNGFWRNADWIHCRPEPKFPNGRWRPVRPGSFPLASRAPARMVRLRGYGDAINARLAAAFIRAYRHERGLDTTPFPYPWLGVSDAS